MSPNGKPLRNKPAVIAIALLLLFICGSTWLVFEYVAAEKQRDLDAWQARLSVMAESQQHAIESWFEKQLENINGLANNPLLQLYVSRAPSAGTSDDETSRGQLQHLKNLINATAANAGVFTPVKNLAGNEVSRVNDGLAIINKSGVLLATRYFPGQDVIVLQAYKRALLAQSLTVSNIYDAGGGQPRLIIVMPVRSVQSLDSDDIRAAVVAVINPQDNLFKLLAKDWVTTESDESLLVALDDNNVNYLSPLKRGYKSFHKQPRSTTAEGTVASTVGEFATLPDYRQTNVLAVARAIRFTKMILVQKIDVDEALAESTAHQAFLLTALLLAVLLIAISFIAIWWHASSSRLQKAKKKLEARATLLNAVADSINDHMFLLDHKNRLVFINEALAKSFSINNVDIRGKALNHIFNHEITKRLLAVRLENNTDVRNKEMRLESNGVRFDYHVSIVAVRHPDYKQSHLYVMHDITELKDSQGRQHRFMDNIVSTLVQLIDKHDPHCAHHSERTREVAVATARAMGLPQKRIDDLSMAALLANIGKLYIPGEMLTRIEPLTEDEALILQQNIHHSVEILKDLEFDGPVIEYVQQKNECLDGSGYPNGISGDAIHLESRILSVANAFVAMTSSRAYRPGKPIKDVLEILLSEADRRYDRSVIAALFHVAENHSNWLKWQQVD